MRRYRGVFSLSLAVAVCAGYIYYDRASSTSDELAARRRSAFKTFHRERISRIVVARPSGRYELQKRGADWFVLNSNVARKADMVEVEHCLGELESAEPTRTPGVVDSAARARFGLEHPHATVAVYEGSRVSVRFTIGGAVLSEEASYVETEGRVVVLPKSFAEAFDRASTELRDKAVADLDVSRIDSLELTVGASRRVLSRQGLVWRLNEPSQGRASRGAVEAITTELRELRAARVLEDDVSEAAMERYGLATPSVRLTVRRGTAEPLALRFGGGCAGHEGEVSATREGSSTVVCLPSSFVDALRVAPEALRDDHILASRTDEIGQIRVLGAAGQTELVVRRDGERWVTGDVRGGADAGGSGGSVDGEAVESWLNSLHDLAAGQRLPDDSRAAHGLLPAALSIEVTRTGVDGAEVIHVGVGDGGGLYVSRDDEAIVLQFAPSVSETLRVEPIRFQSRQMIRDLEGDLAALSLEGPSLREDVQKLDGVWRVHRPISAAADGALMIDAARQLADLEVDRWVTATARPEHGLAAPRLRLQARFEGRGLPSDAGARTERLRGYTILFGAQAPGGGVYASLSGASGVGVLPRALFDRLAAPHLDRSVLHVNASDVAGVVITQPSGRVEITREGTRWRSAAGAPVEASRAVELLERLNNLIAARVYSYGPPAPSAGFGAFRLEVRRAGDGGAPWRYSFGEQTAGPENVGTYVRRDDIDATMSVSTDFAESLRAFRP